MHVLDCTIRTYYTNIQRLNRRNTYTLFCCFLVLFDRNQELWGGGGVQLAAFLVMFNSLLH
jgi:hypothetical protein